MQQEIKFSILVPVYNVEKYLVECVESVLQQTYQNFELILVDDGSTDSSGTICDEYAQKDSRIKVFHKPNGGLFHTRRYSEQFATGDYVVFLDSDDYIRKDTLEVLLKYITEYGSDCIIYGFSRVTDGGKVTHTVSDKLMANITDKRWMYVRILSDSSCNAVWRKAVKRELVRTEDLSKYYSISMGEDLIQTMEILQNAKNFSFIPEVLYFYRTNPQSITQTFKADKIDCKHNEVAYMFLEKTNLFTYEEMQSYKVKVAVSELANLLLKPVSFQHMLVPIKELYYHPFLQNRTEGIFSKTSFTSQRRIAYFLFEHRMFNLLAALAVLRRWIKG